MRPLLTLLLVLPALALAQEQPLAQVILQPGGEFSEFHRTWQGIPGIGRTIGGRLWATWYSGDTGEGDMGNYALVCTSGNEGQNWSKPFVIKGPDGFRIGDPLPWIDPKGRLWIFYHQVGKTADGMSMRGTFAIRADHPGEEAPTWTAPKLIAEAGILFGKPQILPDGSWLAPYFVNGKPSWEAQMNGKETGVLISKDAGETWTWQGGLSIPQDLRNFSEATLAPRKDGTLVMVIRTNKGLHQSESTDSGKTWSEAIPMAGFPAVVTRACLTKLQSGAWMLIYHDAAATKTGSFPRQRLTAWLSDDEGRTWPHKLAVDERNSVSYPDAVQGHDGRIFIAWDHGRYEPGAKEILLGSIREEDIRAGKIQAADSFVKRIVNRTVGYGNHAELEFEKKTAAAMPPKEKFDLYLLIGQSNMAGRGRVDTEDRTSRLRLLKFSPRNAWTVAMEPLHYDKPGIAGVGLGMSFAREMADVNPDVTVGLIPCAVGGTQVARWIPGGDLYKIAVNRTKLALQHGTLKGILWHQGESDAGSPDTAALYASQLDQVVAGFRQEFGAEIPFVAGQLAPFLQPQNKAGKTMFYDAVNKQLGDLPNRVPRTAIVEATGLTSNPDFVHFDAASLREFGKRYAAAMKKLQ